jgi:biotin carboxylase/catechol 2,3-dioxygenase-like lactoylglutathione lyase family enzyme
MSSPHVLVIGNGRELPLHVHTVAPAARTSMLVRTAVVKKIRDPKTHARIVATSAADAAEWVALAQALHAVEPITHVATFSEKDQDKAAAVAGALRLPMHSGDTVRVVHDKVAMRQRLEAAGLPGTAAELVGTPDDVRAFAQLHGYPVVLKPVAGAASSGVTIVRSDSDVDDAWSWGKSAAEPDTDDLMVEAFLDGPEISVEAFSIAGEHFVVAITGKVKDPVHCVERGHMIRPDLPATTVSAVNDAVVAVLTALGVGQGVTHTELILTADGPRLVETHLRPAGDDIPEMIRDTYQLDLLDLLVRQAIGEDVRDRLTDGLAALARSDRYPAIWYGVPATSGTVRAVTGLDAARAVDGVVSVELEADVGDEVCADLRDSRDRLFAVRAMGDSPECALATARRAAELVFVEIADAAASSPTTAGVISMSDSFELAGLHHVQLAIPPGGEDLARRYYGEILGMTELQKPPVLAARGGCWFRRGGLEVHLGVEKEFRAAAKAHPGILVDDLDALAARLKDSGADVEWDDNFPGHRRFYSHDLHGNRLELLEPEGA